MIIFKIPEEGNGLRYYTFPWNAGKVWNDTIISIKVGRNAKVSMSTRTSTHKGTLPPTGATAKT